MSSISGSCLCGDVGYRMILPAIFLNNCHCSRCRKASGAAFGSYVHASKDRFEWIRGTEKIRAYIPPVGDPRPFCSNCGTRVPLIEEDGVIIPAGSLDGDPGLEPCVNIHAASKADWFEITDGKPIFDEVPPDSFWIPIESEYEKKLLLIPG